MTRAAGIEKTYVRVKGRWIYLHRAVDSRGQTVDFLLSAKRDAEAAKRFFRKALGQPHTVNPHTITVDKNPAYPCAIEQLKEDGELWRFARPRQCKFLHNIVKQDRRRVKRLVRPGMGFGIFHTTRRTLAGYEVMAMVRKGQLREIDGGDMRAQATFVAELFQVAA
ncbi:IS6 family transposase [Roseomonas sp. GCM10028921]